MFGRNKDFIVREYKNQKDYQKGLRKMVGKGYEVVSTDVTQNPKSGMKLLLWLILFPPRLLFRNKELIVVTYRRTN